MKILCCTPRTASPPPETAYKDGLLTPAGWMMSASQCSRTQEDAFAGRSDRYKLWGKELLSRWQEAGFPSLGDWPPENIGLNLMDYCLGAIQAILSASPG